MRFTSEKGRVLLPLLCLLIMAGFAAGLSSLLAYAADTAAAESATETGSADTATSEMTAAAAQFPAPASNGIPAVSLTVDPEEFQKVLDSEDHSYKSAGGSISITVPKTEAGYTNEFSTEALTDQMDLALEYIRGRGNSTWTADKKPFKFKLDKSTDLLGMGKNKHWVLLAGAYDKTLLKNRLTAYIGRELGLAYTPKMVPVDFYVNGTYLGSYLLSEQVRIGKTRVNIDELTPEDNKEPEITGGYIVGLNPYDTEPEGNKFNTEKGISFKLDRPAFESSDPDDDLGTAQQREYITNYLQKTENAIYGEGMKDKDGIPYTDYMDIESAAKYWWVQEFSMNGDAFITPSTYLYKPRNDKLYWGPLWDFDLAYPESDDNKNLNMTSFEWLDYLRDQDPVYQAQLRETWTKFDAILSNITKAGGTLDQYASEIKKSWNQNEKLYKNNENYDLVMKSLKKTVKSRRAGINDCIDEDLTNVFVNVTFKDGDEVLAVVKARIGAYFYEAPDAPEKDGLYFAGWADETGDYESDPNGEGPFEKDTTLYAKYLNEDELIKPEGIWFGRYDVWAKLSDGTDSYGYMITPENAHDKRVSWESSDPSVAEVDESGFIILKSEGTTVITVSSPRGISTSFTYHVYDDKKNPPGKLTGINLEDDSLALEVGQYGQIHYTLEPANSDAWIYVRSSNEKIAEVADCGVIKAVKAGTCKIEVGDEETGVKATYTVTVTDPRAANPMKAKGRTVKARAAKGKKAATKKTIRLKAAKAFTVSEAEGTVTYKKLKVTAKPAGAAGKAARKAAAKNGNKKIAISKAGKATIKKGLKKGTYKVKTRITAAGNDNYQPKAVKAVLTIVVK